MAPQQQAISPEEVTSIDNAAQIAVKMGRVYGLVNIATAIAFFANDLYEQGRMAIFAGLLFFSVGPLVQLKRIVTARFVLVLTLVGIVTFFSLTVGKATHVQWLSAAFMVTVGRIFSVRERNAWLYTGVSFVFCCISLVFCLTQDSIEPVALSETQLKFFQWNVILAFVCGTSYSQFFWLKSARETELKRDAVTQELRWTLFELESSKAFNSALLSTSSVGVFRVDTIGECSFVNPAMTKLIGLSSEEMIGKRWYKALSKNEFERVMPYWKNYVERAEAFSQITELVRPDGRTMWVLIQFAPILNSYGLVDFHVGTLTDVSGLKNAEREIFQMQTKIATANLQLKTLFDQMAEGAVVQDFQDGILEANESAKKILGFEDSALLGKSSNSPELEVFDENGVPLKYEDRPSVKAARTRRPVRNTILGMRRKGQTVWMNVNSVPIFNPESGVSDRVLTTFTDITEMKELETKNKTSRQRLQIAMEGLKFGIWDWDLVNNILVWDDFMYEVFGIDRKDYVGDYDAFQKLLHPEDVGPLNAKLQEVFAAGKNYSGKFRIIRKSGEVRTIEANATCFYSPDGKIQRMVGANWDVTHELEQEAKLIQSSKMSSLGEMSSGIAHEINNPLSVILTRAYVLATQVKKLPDSEKLLAGIDQIRTNCERIDKIIKGLKVFARESDHDPFERIAIRSIIDDVLTLCESRIKTAAVQISVDVDRDLWCVCSSTQISQVILNLVGNAIDATELLSERWIRISAQRVNDRVKISVIDSGSGVPEAVRAKIMQPFFTTKPVGKGTGLGLSISSGIVKSHGGTLVLDDQSPNTCFSFDLQKTS